MESSKLPIPLQQMDGKTTSLLTTQFSILLPFDGTSVTLKMAALCCREDLLLCGCLQRSLFCISLPASFHPSHCFRLDRPDVVYTKHCFRRDRLDVLCTKRLSVSYCLTWKMLRKVWVTLLASDVSATMR